MVSPTRVERSVPLKAIVSQINYNLFDIELGDQQSSLPICRRKTGGYGERRDGGARCGLVERQRHQPERTSDHAVHGVIGQIQQGGLTTTSERPFDRDGLKSAVAQM